MSDPTRPDFSERVEKLRARHEDPREFVDALLDDYNALPAAAARWSTPFVDEILRVSREIGYERGEANGLLAEGFVHYLWQRNQEAFARVLEAKPRLDALENEIFAQARCSTVLTGLHTTMGNIQKALEHGHEALAKLADQELAEWHGWPNYMLGDAYRAMGDLERARKHYGDAYEAFVANEVEAGLARALIGLGSVCREQGDLEESERYFLRAQALSEKRNDSITMARIQSDLALIRQLSGGFDEALELFEESLRIRREQGGGLVVATCLIDLGRLLLEIGRPDEAIDRLSEALEISAEHDHGPRMYAAHEGLAAAYAGKGDLDKALFHQREFQRVKEEVMTADATTRLQNLEISLEAAAAQKEAELVMAHNEELRSKNTELARLLNELREAQEMLIQSEKMASLGQLTAGIAHEIKNPLNFVNNFSAMTKGLAEELSEEIVGHRADSVAAVESEFLELTREIIANAERVLEHGHRAGQIVNSMLVHSRHSGGKKTEVDVNEFVETCADLAVHSFAANNDDYEPQVERDYSDAAGSFQVIEEDFARVVNNILHNALYATRRRAADAADGFEPQIRIRTTREDGSVKITISDNGPGIPDQHKQKVFEPFFTTKPTGAGTGLGLSQSYEIVTKRHGGTLQVTDTEGGGATFVVGIPVG